MKSYWDWLYIFKLTISRAQLKLHQVFELMQNFSTHWIPYTLQQVHLYRQYVTERHKNEYCWSYCVEHQYDHSPENTVLFKFFFLSKNFSIKIPVFRLLFVYWPSSCPKTHLLDRNDKTLTIDLKNSSIVCISIRTIFFP